MSVWTAEEENECRELIIVIDDKLKAKNDEVHALHKDLYQSYLIIRNLTALTIIVTGLFYFFGMNTGSILGVQTTGLFILIALFGNFESKGKNRKWFKALKTRANLHELRQTIRADLDTGIERTVGPWKDYKERILSSVP